MFRSRELLIFKRGIYTILSFVLLLWTVKSVEWANGVDLGVLGILPRTLKGSIGIITGPLVHGDVFHLLSNTFPLLVLGLGLFYFYHKIAFEVFIWIYLASGFWVWIIGREAYHIGASGLVYGLMMFIFWGGLLRRNPKSLAISMIIFFLYGYMIYGLVPGDDSVSWESHVMGSVAGVFLAFYFKKVPIYTGENDPFFADDETGTEEINAVNKADKNSKKDSVNHTHQKDIFYNYTFIPGKTNEKK